MSKRIPLTQGKFAVVDESDFELLSKFKWFAHRSLETGTYYVSRSVIVAPKKQKSLRMHRFLLGLDYGDRRMVDHIDRDGLNNRRSNLRICANAENCRNQKLRKNNTSGFKGVNFHSWKQKWTARICVNYKRISLGDFDCPRAAYRAYKKAAVIHHKEFSRTK